LFILLILYMIIKNLNFKSLDKFIVFTGMLIVTIYFLNGFDQFKHHPLLYFFIINLSLNNKYENYYNINNFFYFFLIYVNIKTIFFI